MRTLILAALALAVISAGNAAAITTTTSETAVELRSPDARATVSGAMPLVVRTAPWVAYVNFYLDAIFVASSPPNDISWNTISWNTAATTNGPHTLTARAFDAADREVGVDSIAVNVSNSAAAHRAGRIDPPRLFVAGHRAR
jgi:hypothetical protein